MNEENANVEVVETTVAETEDENEQVESKKDKLIRGLKTAGKVARNVLAIIGGGVVAVAAIRAITGEDDVDPIVIDTNDTTDTTGVIDVNYEDVEPTETTEEL